MSYRLVRTIRMNAVPSHFVMVLVDVIVRCVHLFLCSQISQEPCSVSGV
jgi:hypothetical protein